MVGGTLSPDQQQQNSNSDSDGDTTYSSYESDDYRRTSYDRRNKRREKYGSSRSERNDRDRNRERRERHNRETEKEVCLRFSEFGHCPDVCELFYLIFSILYIFH